MLIHDEERRSWKWSEEGRHISSRFMRPTVNHKALLLRVGALGACLACYILGFIGARWWFIPAGLLAMWLGGMSQLGRRRSGLLDRLAPKGIGNTIVRRIATYLGLRT